MENSNVPKTYVINLHAVAKLLYFEQNSTNLYQISTGYS